jgi:hypothetical protein
VAVLEARPELGARHHERRASCRPTSAAAWRSRGSSRR